MTASASSIRRPTACSPAPPREAGGALRGRAARGNQAARLAAGSVCVRPRRARCRDAGGASPSGVGVGRIRHRSHRDVLDGAPARRAVRRVRRRTAGGARGRRPLAVGPQRDAAHAVRPTSRLPTPDSRLPTPDPGPWCPSSSCVPSRWARNSCRHAFPRRTGRVVPVHLGRVARVPERAPAISGSDVHGPSLHLLRPRPRDMDTHGLPRAGRCAGRAPARGAACAGDAAASVRTLTQPGRIRHLRSAVHRRPRLARRHARIARVLVPEVGLHRRLRPEELGGRLEAGAAGAPIVAWPDPRFVQSDAFAEMRRRTGTCLLPMAWPEGAPLHPAYPSAHAATAGAMVTVLKAYYAEEWVMPDVVEPSLDGSECDRSTRASRWETNSTSSPGTSRLAARSPACNGAATPRPACASAKPSPSPCCANSATSCPNHTVPSRSARSTEAPSKSRLGTPNPRCHVESSISHGPSHLTVDVPWARTSRLRPEPGVGCSVASRPGTAAATPRHPGAVPALNQKK